MSEVATLGTIAEPAIDEMFALSPYVWPEAGRYRMLMRLVNRAMNARDKVSRVHSGSSADGVTFRLDAQPAISPGPGPDAYDAHGCEDPTAVPGEHGVDVFYSGWNEDKQTGTLLRAHGPRIDRLSKKVVAIPSSAAFRNPKEASLARCGDASWVLFFEYAADDASKIGLARATGLDGPWTIDETFDFPARPDAWDAWHLSPGPIVVLDGTGPTMLYNGGTRDGAWRIGSATFDEQFSRIVERPREPLIVPPPPSGDDADIAFVASAFVNDDGTLSVYYSIADRFCKRATLEVA